MSLYKQFLEIIPFLKLTDAVGKRTSLLPSAVTAQPKKARVVHRAGLDLWVAGCTCIEPSYATESNCRLTEAYSSKDSGRTLDFSSAKPGQG